MIVRDITTLFWMCSHVEDGLGRLHPHSFSISTWTVLSLFPRSGMSTMYVTGETLSCKVPATGHSTCLRVFRSLQEKIPIHYRLSQNTFQRLSRHVSSLSTLCSLPEFISPIHASLPAFLSCVGSTLWHPSGSLL